MAPNFVIKEVVSSGSLNRGLYWKDGWRGNFWYFVNRGWTEMQRLA